MTPEQRCELDSRGVACLRGAVDREVALGIRDRVWAVVEARSAIRRDDRSTWRRVPPAIVKQAREREGLFDPILGPTTSTALDAVLGEGGWVRPQVPGQLLMTPPDPGEWLLPAKMWHVDAPAPSGVDGAGLQLFLLLDRIEPRGGATVVVAGFHRLVRGLPERENPRYEGHSADLRKVLGRRVPWLRDLWRPGPNTERMERLFARASDHEGVPLQVVELTGEPGDVWMMDLWTLHGLAMNRGDRMRMVATERLFVHGFLGTTSARSPDGRKAPARGDDG